MAIQHSEAGPRAFLSLSTYTGSAPSTQHHDRVQQNQLDGCPAQVLAFPMIHTMYVDGVLSMSTTYLRHSGQFGQRWGERKLKTQHVLRRKQAKHECPNSGGARNTSRILCLAGILAGAQSRAQTRHIHVYPYTYYNIFRKRSRALTRQ